MGAADNLLSKYKITDLDIIHTILLHCLFQGGILYGHPNILDDKIFRPRTRRSFLLQSPHFVADMRRNQLSVSRY